mmetsp:Transcript_58972/g.113723  ORF Transcript_58972/g.113723 Transcript_58972/m.113723 type:complete len:88 (-) Transcript_58972:153-416(-)
MILSLLKVVGTLQPQSELVHGACNSLLDQNACQFLIERWEFHGRGGDSMPMVNKVRKSPTSQSVPGQDSVLDITFCVLTWISGLRNW